MSVLTVLLFHLLSQCQSLKIALGDGHGNGFGSGSTDLRSAVTALAPVVGSPPASSTITTAGGVLADIMASAFLPSSFSSGVTVPKTGSIPPITIPSAVAAEMILGKLAPGDTVGIGASSPPLIPIPSLAFSLLASVSVEIIFTKTSAGGVVSEVPVSGLTTGEIEITLVKTSSKTLICVFFDTAIGDWSTVGIKTKSQTGSTITCGASHLTPIGAIPTPTPAGAKGDPKATNLAGQKFEILAMGTFSLLSVKSTIESTNRLTLDATVDRAGDMCGATYIKNATLTGSWIQEEGKLSEIKIAALPEVAKETALEVGLDGNWYSAKATPKLSKLVKIASSKEIQFVIHEVKIKVGVDAHRVRKNGRKTGKFANFLNIDVDGMKGLASKEGVQLSGLLAYDDHRFAESLPDGCNSKSFHFKQKSDSDSEMSSDASDAFFVSSMKIE